MHRLNRRQLIATAGVLAASGRVGAQMYPSRPIRLVVPFPPGGPTDAVARYLANDWQSRSGWQVIVDNKPGASGFIGHEEVRRQPPDGYTLMSLVNPAVVNYKFLNRPFVLPGEFTPLGRVHTQYIALVVNPKVAGMQDVHTLKDLLAVAGKASGRLAFTSAGNGSMGHLATLAICNRAGVTMTHVPYRGDAPAISDVLGGTVPVMHASSGTALPHIRSGRLRAISVSSATRAKDLPDVPTIEESGFPGIVATAWSGLVAPSGISAELVDRLTQSLRDTVANPAIQQKLQESVLTPDYLPPREFADFVNRDFALWSKVIADNKIQAS